MYNISTCWARCEDASGIILKTFLVRLFTSYCKKKTFHIIPYPINNSVYPINNSVYLIYKSVYLIYQSVYLIYKSVYPINNSVYTIYNSVYPINNSVYPINNSVYLIYKSVYPINNSVYPINNSFYPINLLTAITSRVATLISASSKGHVTIEYHVMCLVFCSTVRWILYSTVKFYFHNFIFEVTFF